MGVRQTPWDDNGVNHAHLLGSWRDGLRHCHRVHVSAPIRWAQSREPFLRVAEGGPPGHDFGVMGSCELASSST